MFLNFFKSLKNYIKFLNLPKNEKPIIFYSENKFYRYHFIDLIENFKILTKKKIIFITSDKDDYVFFKDKYDSYFISNIFILNEFFKKLNCEFLIMTLTDLGSHLPKSPNCKKYIYFFHAMASTNKVYTKNAFNSYDIILTIGNYQKLEIQEVEKLLNLNRKEIINTGYFYIDRIKKEANLKITKRDNILFAPSWNYKRKNLFDDYSKDIISNLIDKGFNVTLRPHPEHYKRSKKTIDRIIKLFGNNDKFEFDYDISNLKSMEKAELIITDNSTIVFEYYLIFKRPLIYLEYSDKVHNSFYENTRILPIEEIFKKRFGKTVTIKSLNDLGKICREEIENKKIDVEDLNDFINDHLSNFDYSAKFAAETLVKKIEKNK